MKFFFKLTNKRLGEDFICVVVVVVIEDYTDKEKIKLFEELKTTRLSLNTILKIQTTQ